MSFQCHYQPLFVILSYTISVLGAYCSLQWAAQIPLYGGRARSGWLAGAAVAMGGGAIWSMHFIAMLACRLPVTVHYDFGLTLASLLVAIVVTGMGLRIVSGGMGNARLLAAGLITGLGVAAMHYTGMAAMQLPARVTYRPGLVAASLVIALAAATAALWIAFHLGKGWQRLGASLVMGVAVCGMHYTGMAAAVFVPTHAPTSGRMHSGLESNGLAYMVFGVTLGVLLLLSLGGRLIEGKRAEVSRRQAHAELEALVEARTAALANVNAALKTEITERERAYAERARLALFTADVGGALTRSESLTGALEASAEAMVRHLGAATASIWVLSTKEPVLERRATAGSVGELPDALEQIPVGQYRIGRIAQDGRPRIVDLASDPHEPGDKDWARQAGMISFAGHPLTVAGRSLGVMAMFARERITQPALHAMATVADAIALGIDRARATDSLRASETLTRSIIEGMREGLITVDAASEIRSVNSAAERLFGYTRDELVGKPISCLIPDEGIEDAAAFLRAARLRAMGRLTEWQGRRKDGSTFPLELSLFEFWTSEGRHFGGAVKDLSERHEVDRLKREFVSTVSHELRTPLTSIRGALGLVVGGAAGALPAQARGLLDIALKNSERLARLVNDILDMEKIESGQLEFRMEDLELAPLLTAAVEGVRSYAEQYGVALAVEQAAPGVRIRADADRFAQVVTNLLSNAVKFSPRGETVRLIAAGRGSSVRLEIVDRGPGIPEEFRSRIFGRFQQADSSDTRQKGGTGLGLAITRLIVENLGGTVGFETQIGQGSTFWVELPRAGSPAVAAAREGGTWRPRILHVDDDPDLPTIVKAALSVFADVDNARGVHEARARLASQVYDAVVLDVGLPDGSGFDLTPLLTGSSGVATPFVFFTAQEISREAGGAAAAIFVKSRSSVDELVEAVRSLVAGAPGPVAVPASEI
jgi:PAS domain S-box-containing protein